MKVESWGYASVTLPSGNIAMFGGYNKNSKVLSSCEVFNVESNSFSDIGDMKALKENVLRSKALGFDGMGCIHPRQIKVIFDNYAPTDQEIENAKIIVIAFIEAAQNGYGVVSVGNKMIDAPVVSRAQQTINRAISMGKLGAKWISRQGNGTIIA